MYDDIEINLSEQEMETYIRCYITENMLPETLNLYVDVLNKTDDLAEASKTAILNEHINIAVKNLLDLESRKE